MEEKPSCWRYKKNISLRCISRFWWLTREWLSLPYAACAQPHAQVIRYSQLLSYTYNRAKLISVTIRLAPHHYSLSLSAGSPCYLSTQLACSGITQQQRQLLVQVLCSRVLHSLFTDLLLAITFVSLRWFLTARKFLQLFFLRCFCSNSDQQFHINYRIIS